MPGKGVRMPRRLPGDMQAFLVAKLILLTAASVFAADSGKNIFDENWEPPRPATPPQVIRPTTTKPATPSPQPVQPQPAIPAVAQPAPFRRMPVPPVADQTRSRTLLKD